MKNKKKSKKKSSIFPPETAEAQKAPNPQMALANPTDAAVFSSHYAGLDAVGSINEEYKESFYQTLRNTLKNLER